eukprot:gnl/Carplike_NY0171/3324_a4473_456.p1 GENE.gnl/Carplike_NY0171/3324_a4473_456~~gnl/Carplike_NY0171/3324_a4473_456.p1  ORF type:complete len:474 (-),score=143.81 gnl/Carplike_NY0171/3324_a4473_456:267-1688(-)
MKKRKKTPPAVKKEKEKEKGEEIIRAETPVSSDSYDDLNEKNPSSARCSLRMDFKFTDISQSEGLMKPSTLFNTEEAPIEPLHGDESLHAMETVNEGKEGQEQEGLGPRMVDPLDISGDLHGMEISQHDSAISPDDMASGECVSGNATEAEEEEESSMSSSTSSSDTESSSSSSSDPSAFLPPSPLLPKHHKQSLEKILQAKVIEQADVQAELKSLSLAPPYQPTHGREFSKSSAKFAKKQAKYIKNGGICEYISNKMLAKDLLHFKEAQHIAAHLISKKRSVTLRKGYNLYNEVAHQLKKNKKIGRFARKKQKAFLTSCDVGTLESGPWDRPDLFPNTIHNHIYDLMIRVNGVGGLVGFRKKLWERISSVLSRPFQEAPPDFIFKQINGTGLDTAWDVVYPIPVSEYQELSRLPYEYSYVSGDGTVPLVGTRIDGQGISSERIEVPFTGHFALLSSTKTLRVIADVLGIEVK